MPKRGYTSDLHEGTGPVQDPVRRGSPGLPSSLPEIPSQGTKGTRFAERCQSAKRSEAKRWQAQKQRQRRVRKQKPRRRQRQVQKRKQSKGDQDIAKANDCEDSQFRLESTKGLKGLLAATTSSGLGPTGSATAQKKKPPRKALWTSENGTARLQIPIVHVRLRRLLVLLAFGHKKVCKALGRDLARHSPIQMLRTGPSKCLLTKCGFCVTEVCHQGQANSSTKYVKLQTKHMLVCQQKLRFPHLEDRGCGVPIRTMHKDSSKR